MSEQSEIYSGAGFGHRVPKGLRPAVLVVDLSYGFTDPRYPTATDMADEIAATNLVLRAARAAVRPVIFTTIAYDPWETQTLAWLRKSKGMAALLRGTRLVEIDGRLMRRPDEPVVVKQGASAFHGTNLASTLTAAAVDTVIVVGATTSGCVRATVVDAVQCGFNVLVPRECVADRAEAPHAASLYDIDQKYGDVIPLADTVDYLAATAPTLRSQQA